MILLVVENLYSALTHPVKCGKVLDVSVFAEYKGCPIPDTDGDGVNDREDQCINEAAKTSSGCPVYANPVIRNPETILDTAVIIQIRPSHNQGTTTSAPPKADSTVSGYFNASLAYNFHSRMKKGEKVSIQIIVELDHATHLVGTAHRFIQFWKAFLIE